MKILNYVDSYVNEFFFSDKNIIVEGFTEKLRVVSPMTFLLKTY